MKKIAVFASGSGTNAENVISHFKTSSTGKVTLLLSNKSDAYALVRARGLGIPTFTFSRDDFYVKTTVLDLLKNEQIDCIVLAGFLWLVPQNIIEAYRGRIINIHPALLPNYGGKGMYGDHVHRAVIAAQESESGITIHHVNEQFDSGDTIFQARVALTAQDTPETLAAKIHDLEQQYFPTIIEQELNKA